MNREVRDLYQAIIVDHSKSPRHRGPLPGATCSATVDNPLCGDVVTMHLQLDGERVAAAGFEGHGCALSQAAASILSERLPGLDRAAARALLDRFAAFVAAPPADATADDAALGDLTAFAGVRAFRSRQACATLAARAAVRALDGSA